MYIWTTSVPSRLPVLVTSTVTRVRPVSRIFFFASRRFSKRERGVAQAEAEGIQRRHVVEQITAARRGLVIVERRQMARGARNGDRQFAARVGVAEQHFRDRVTALLPQIPALENRRHVWLSELIEIGRPLNRSTITGLPVATIARTSSSCRPTRSRLGRSPMCLSDQASRDVCSLPPIASTITSACFATLTASAICRRSSAGSLGITSSCVPRAADGDLAAFAVDHLRAVADPRSDAIEHRDLVLRHAAVAAQQRAIRIRPDHRDGLEFCQIKRQQGCLRSSAA